MAPNNKKKKPKAASAKPPARGSEVDVQMQKVLELLSDRTRGNATNEEIETAVSNILSAAGLDSSQSQQSQTKPAPPKRAPQKNIEPKIELDMEDYDDDDDDEDDTSKKQSNEAKHSSAPPQEATSPSQDDTKEPQQTGEEEPPKKRKRGRPRKDVNQSVKERKLERAKRDELYEHIPLGKQGASMMTAFGDGPDPKPQAVLVTLLGARRLLQVTIQDARALRRKATQQFQKAQIDVAKHSKANNKDTDNNNSKHDNNNPRRPIPAALPDAHMLYRAFEGYDKLSYAPKCGFDFEQLSAMYPEEMRAYTRWNQLRDEYASKSDDKDIAEKAEKNGDDTDLVDTTTAESSSNNNNNNNNKSDETGGHLLERAVQFDVRTSLMDKGWYMKFSEHRKGSFLPRRLKEEGDKDWEAQRKATKGKKENGVWSNMSANSARFLHWVGFDPNKGLPPPNDETTNALAFLGYDFFGRIVEKAIFLKNLSKARLSNEEVDERTILMELADGEQLEKSDIDKAMHDINPVSLYSTATSGEGKPFAQLYFGPSFEYRLELELEELMCGGAERSDISPEEAKIRREEDKLFGTISAPPSTSKVMDLLDKKGDEGDQTLA